MEKLEQEIVRIKAELIQLRRELHRFPELGFQEVKTAARVAGYLRDLGLQVDTGIGGTGVVGLLQGESAGPTLALRACLDALAITERSGLAYASENPGVMHACGHDGNIAMVLGAAKVLTKCRDRLKGGVKFIFQPAEEDTGGAAEMIGAGVLKNPDVEAIITLHNWHGLRQGVLVARPGPVLASSDVFRLKILGTPGHGAWPHLAVDPVVVAAAVITGLQTLVSREIDPLRAAALTIGKVYGGTAVNIIPESVTLEGTVRTFDAPVRDFIQGRIEQLARGITGAARASCELTYDRIMPPVDNDPRLTATVASILKKAFDPGLVTDDFQPSMGCEEFALFQARLPGLFLFIGNDREGCRSVPIHAPDYTFNDDILAGGVKALCAIALNYGSASPVSRRG